MLQETAAETTYSLSADHVKVEKKEEQDFEEEQVDPMYDIAEPQYAENVIQHLEIVPVSGEMNEEM